MGGWDSIPSETLPTLNPNSKLELGNDRRAMASFVVEYAKSARSACKHCKVELAKGEMRIGIISKGPGGFDMTKWHHSKCLLELKALTDASDLLKMRGFPTLKISDQSSLRELFQQGSTEQVGKGRKRMWNEQDAKPLALVKSMEVRYDKASWEEKLSRFEQASTYKDSLLPYGWKSFASIIFNESKDFCSSEKVAAFDFDGCLVNTSVKRVGADAWSLLYTSIPQKLQAYHEEGYKLLVFTNESNIDRWTKSRQKAIDSKIGRLKGFLCLVKVPMQVLIACGKEGTGDPCRKPAPGMWDVMERHLNENVVIDKSRSFYVGDAAGRVGDHSAADLGFAKAVGLKFFVPEDIFENANKTD